jgi:hypothetical protein
LIPVDRDSQIARDTATRFVGEGHIATNLHCDVAEPTSVAALATTIIEQGAVHSRAVVVGSPPSQGDSCVILRVNVTWATIISKEAFARLAPGGSAVFISSLGGHIIPAEGAVTASLDHPQDPHFFGAIEVAAGAAINASTAYA